MKDKPGSFKGLIKILIELSQLNYDFLIKYLFFKSMETQSVNAGDGSQGFTS